MGNFWQGFEKQAIRGGGKGYTGTGEGSISGGLLWDEYEGTQEGHGRADGEDTRADKELLDRDRTARDFSPRHLGPEFEVDSVPIKY